jgi:glycosyltransferase involved in cell wall biosynthesis
LALEDLAIVVLVVGKLVQAKAPEHAVQGMALLHQTTAANVHLVFAGDGPERSNLEGLAARVLPGRAHFPGFVNVDRLPAFYVAADILLHPSAVDAHPLATSEGVYCGLPAVVSDRVGSVGPSDDVRPGENGLAYPYGDIEALEEALRALLPPSQRNSFSAKSREIGRSRSLEASAQGFVRALTSIL